MPKTVYVLKYFGVNSFLLTLGSMANKTSALKSKRLIYLLSLTLFYLDVSQHLKIIENPSRNQSLVSNSRTIDLDSVSKTGNDSLSAIKLSKVQSSLNSYSCVFKIFS